MSATIGAGPDEAGADVFGLVIRMEPGLEVTPAIVARILSFQASRLAATDEWHVCDVAGTYGIWDDKRARLVGSYRVTA